MNIWTELHWIVHLLCSAGLLCSMLEPLWDQGISTPSEFMRWLLVPSSHFSDTAMPAAPDYKQEANWAAIGRGRSGSGWFPRGCNQSFFARAKKAANGGEQDEYDDDDEEPPFDVFFVPPTSHYFGTWNAPANGVLTNLITYLDIREQATALNEAARVFAPRYRQVSQGALDMDAAEFAADKSKALDLAYGDVQRAFDFWVQHFNMRRPWFLAAHSQGTQHAVRLLRYIYKSNPLDVSRRLVAAYLLGSVVDESSLKGVLPVCKSRRVTSCYVSFNAVAEGRDGPTLPKGSHTSTCINPLSWRQDEERIGRDAHRGAIRWGVSLWGLLPFGIGEFLFKEPDTALQVLGLGTTQAHNLRPQSSPDAVNNADDICAQCRCPMPKRHSLCH